MKEKGPSAVLQFRLDAAYAYLMIPNAKSFMMPKNSRTILFSWKYTLERAAMPHTSRNPAAFARWMPRNVQYTAVLFLTAVLLSGCGKEEQLSNTKQGMNAVEALQYEEALGPVQRYGRIEILLRIIKIILGQPDVSPKIESILLIFRRLWRRARTSERCTAVWDWLIWG